MLSPEEILARLCRKVEAGEELKRHSKPKTRKRDGISEFNAPRPELRGVDPMGDDKFLDKLDSKL